MINFAIVNTKCWPVEDSEIEFVLYLIDIDKQYVLRAINNYERNVWIEMI